MFLCIWQNGHKPETPSAIKVKIPLFNIEKLKGIFVWCVLTSVTEAYFFKNKTLNLKMVRSRLDLRKYILFFKLP